MSDTFSYEVEVKPSPATIGLNVEISDSEVEAKITSIPDFKFDLLLRGKYIQKVCSKVIWPIAWAIAKKFENEPNKVLKGKSYKIVDVGTYTTEGIVVTPSELALNSYTPAGSEKMVELTGSLTLSSKP